MRDRLGGDSDGLSDAEEVDRGTNPTDADTDGDGVDDGRDVEFIQDQVAGLPDSAFRDSGDGLRTAIHNRLDAVEAAVARGDTDRALRQLRNLRRHLDGCGERPDGNDWITDCDAQTRIRDLVDTLITNLRG